MAISLDSFKEIKEQNGSFTQENLQPQFYRKCE